VSKKVKIGMFFPDFVWPDNTMEPLERMRACIERCEHYGFDIWVPEHLLAAPGLYGTTWLDPMLMLTYAAALTKNVRVGTNIMVLPVRQPVLLAKEVGSLMALSGNRFDLGIGPGWNAVEYTAVGAHISERGGRTDEILEALERLTTTENVSFHGKYYSFDGVTTLPRHGMPPIWVAGGSRIPDDNPDDHDLPELHPNVLRRIVRWGRWLARASGRQEWIKRDWDQIAAFARKQGQEPDSILFGCANWFQFSKAKTREDALAEQKAPLLRVMGTHRPLHQLQECYLMGTNKEVIHRLQDLIDHGCRYLSIGPLSADPEQIDILANEIAPELGAA
jgi:hypothetical protein